MIHEFGYGFETKGGRNGLKQQRRKPAHIKREHLVYN